MEMTSSCTQGSLDKILGFFFHRRDCKSLEQTSQASGGVIILGSVQKICGYGN